MNSPLEPACVYCDHSLYSRTTFVGVADVEINSSNRSINLVCDRVETTHWAMLTQESVHVSVLPLVSRVILLVFRHPVGLRGGDGQRYEYNFHRTCYGYPRMNHDWKTDCGNPDCGGTCFVCCCGICRNCGCAEGITTTDCPGEPPSHDQIELIYGGLLDFVEGKWVAKLL